jgi:hypothetical protein
MRLKRDMNIDRHIHIIVEMSSADEVRWRGEEMKADKGI